MTFAEQWDRIQEANKDRPEIIALQIAIEVSRIVCEEKKKRNFKTDREYAAFLGLAHSFLKKVMNADSNLKIETIARILKPLGYKPVLKIEPMEK